MHFSKLVFSALALAAVSVSATPAPSNVAQPAPPGATGGVKPPSPKTDSDALPPCIVWCPPLCGELGYPFFECSGE